MGIASGAFGYQTPRKKFAVQGSGQPSDYGGPRWAQRPPPAGSGDLIDTPWRMPRFATADGSGPTVPVTKENIEAHAASGGQQQPMNWENGRATVGDNALGLGNTEEKPWNFVPRPGYNRAGPPATRPDMGDTILRRGHLGFADQMQGAMSDMMTMNLNNQQASLRNKDMWLNYLLGRDQAAAQVEAEKIRAMALAAALGGGGGHGGKPRMHSNIGQSINPWG